MARSKTKFAPRIFLQKYKMKSFLSRIRIHIYFCDTVPLKACVKVLRNGSTPRSIILWGDLLSALPYWGETDSAQYDAAWSSKSRRTRSSRKEDEK